MAKKKSSVNDYADDVEEEYVDEEDDEDLDEAIKNLVSTPGPIPSNDTATPTTTKKKQPVPKRKTPATNKRKKTAGSDDSADEDWGASSRGGKRGRKPAAASSGKRKKNKYFDDDDDDEDDESDFSNDLGDSSDSDSDSDPFEDDYGEDLFRDENDRAYLMSLSELKREEILTERRDLREQYINRKILKKKLKEQEKSRMAIESGQAAGTRRSARKASTDKEKRQSRFKEIRESRERQQTNAAALLASTSTSDANAEANKEDASKVPKRRIYASDESEEEEENENVESSQAQSEVEEPKIQDMISMQLTRRDMLRFLHLPNFEEKIVGLFARVNIGSRSGKPIYRVTEIVNVVEQKPYVVDSVLTNRFIAVKFGLSSRIFRIKFVSNQPIEKSEFIRWMDEMKHRNLHIPSPSQVENYRRRVEYIRQHIFSPQEIEEIVKAKQQLQQLPNDLVRGKSVLLHQISVAQQKLDHAEVEKLEKKLKQLEESRQEMNKIHDQQLTVMENLNKKNRDKQAAELAKAIPLRLQKEAEPSPFTRRSIISQMTPAKEKPKPTTATTNADAVEATKNDSNSNNNDSNGTNANANANANANNTNNNNNKGQNNPVTAEVKPPVLNANTVSSDILMDMELDIDIDISGNKTIPLEAQVLRANATPAKKLSPFVAQSPMADPLYEYKKQRGLI